MGHVTYSVSMVIEGERGPCGCRRHHRHDVSPEGSETTSVINLTFNICQTKIAADKLQSCLTSRSGRSIFNTHVGRARLVWYKRRDEFAALTPKQQTISD